jgi:hypothetical protein
MPLKFLRIASFWEVLETIWIVFVILERKKMFFMSSLKTSSCLTCLFVLTRTDKPIGLHNFHDIYPPFQQGVWFLNGAE